MTLSLPLLSLCRHLSGITACVVMIYTTVLYFTVEMTPREGNFQFNKNPAGTTALIVLDIFFGKCYSVHAPFI
jgi:hypothetical protein